MNQVWFTADTHWFHYNIIKYCKRPFNTVEEMNEAMISNWNAVVNRGDTVYHLGDFAFAKTTHQVNHILKRLNGQVHIIFGGHDRDAVKKADFASKSTLKSIKIKSQTIVLCHYAMRVWDKSHYGSYHLYGHSHGSLPDDLNSLSCDVGVDCWGFTPVSYDQVVEAMSKKSFVPIDHHK